MKLSKSSIIQLSKEAVHCDVEDEVVILCMNDGVYYGLNSVGAFIWNIIKKPKSVDEIHRAIIKEYDIGKEESERDLMELLNDLLNKGLIEITDDS